MSFLIGLLVNLLVKFLVSLIEKWISSRVKSVHATNGAPVYLNTVDLDLASHRKDFLKMVNRRPWFLLMGSLRQDIANQLFDHMLDRYNAQSPVYQYDPILKSCGQAAKEFAERLTVGLNGSVEK